MDEVVPKGLNCIPSSIPCMEISALRDVSMGAYCYPNNTVVVERLAESSKSTLSAFKAYGSNSEELEGYILEPGGSSTSASGLDKRIPEGIYKGQKTYSSHFKGQKYLLTNSDVGAGRGIRVHSGAYHFHTRGCPLPGSGYGFAGQNYYVKGSDDMVKLLEDLLQNNKAVFIFR